MAIVADHKTLAAMERKGFIVRNGKGRDRERHWTGEMVPVITVAPGPKLEQWYTPFEFNGVMYGFLVDRRNLCAFWSIWKGL